MSAVAVVKHLFHEYYPYWTARRRNRSVHKLTKHIACLTRIYTSAVQRWLNSIQLVFHSFFCYIPSMCWCCVILCYFVSNWLPASSSPIEIFILSARSYTEVHSFFSLCVVYLFDDVLVLCHLYRSYIYAHMLAFISHALNFEQRTVSNSEQFNNILPHVDVFIFIPIIYTHTQTTSFVQCFYHSLHFFHLLFFIRYLKCILCWQQNWVEPMQLFYYLWINNIHTHIT